MDKKQLKQYKSTFHFGASVRYYSILTRGHGECEFMQGVDDYYPKETIGKVWKQKLIPTRTGIVIGWRWLSNGIGNYDSESGNCYTATESLFAIEVKRAMMNKVDLVLPESLTLNKGGKYWYSPLFLGIIPDRIPTMSDKDRQRLSTEMKPAPRDSKGRWK